MEYTRDVLADRFGVPGGSAVLSDGAYYWRLDGADYVETYGIGLPSAFLDQGQERDLQPPEFDRTTYVMINSQLEAMTGSADMVIFGPDGSRKPTA